MFLKGCVCFPADRRRHCLGTIRAVQVDCILLSKEQYAVTWIVRCLSNLIFYLSYLRKFNVKFVSICCVFYLLVGPCHNVRANPGFSSRRPKSTPRPGRLLFTLVQRGTGGQIFFFFYRLLRLSPLTVFPSMLHTYSFVCNQRYIYVTDGVFK